MRYVKSGPAEFLVVGRRGRVRSRGVAASAFVAPGGSFVRVPAARQEAAFSMTQESRDGISLRFKGAVIYRVVEPALTATMFDFSAGEGTEQIASLLGHICLGELRAAAARLSMNECIEQRKTTLTSAVADGLRAAVQEPPGWGIALEVIQVAQVFIVDDALREKLEAELQSELATKGELAALRARETLACERAASQRRLAQQELETERERHDIARERRELEQQLERGRIESEAPLRALAIARRRETLELEIALRQRENALRALEVDGELLEQRARDALRRQMLPLEQAPQVAKALAGVLRGVRLTSYGDGAAAELLGQLSPLLAELVSRVREGD